MSKLRAKKNRVIFKRPTLKTWKNSKQLDKANNKISFVRHADDSDQEGEVDEDTIKNIVNFYKFKDEANSDYDEDQNFSESHYDNFDQIDEKLKNFQYHGALGSL